MDYLEFHVVFSDPRPLAEVGAAVSAALEVPMPVTPAADFGDRRDQDRCVGRTLGMEVSLRQGAASEQGFLYRLGGATRTWFSAGAAGHVRIDAAILAV